MMDPFLIKRLWRRPWMSLCILLLTGVLCFLLCYLSGYRQDQSRELERTKASFDILCVVTNRRGTESVSLRMGSSAYYFLTDPEGAMPPLIRDLRATKEFHVFSGGLYVDQELMIGVTNERCAEELDPAMGGETVLFTEDFYGSDAALCLISQEKYERLLQERLEQAELEGETYSEAQLRQEVFTLSVTDPYVYPQTGDGSGIGKTELRLGGYYSGGGESIFIPFRTSQNLAAELSGRVSTDSLAFLAADNSGLEELVEAASEVFGTVDPLAAEHSMPRLALTVHDAQYQATVAALEQNIRRTEYLLPVVAVLGLGVGFLISFLSTRGERRTYGLMRTLGMTRGRLVASVLLEQLALAILSTGIVAAATGSGLPALVSLCCYTVGCCAAVIRLLQIPPTAILREQE